MLDQLELSKLNSYFTHIKAKLSPRRVDPHFIFSVYFILYVKLISFLYLNIRYFYFKFRYMYSEIYYKINDKLII